MNQMRLQKLVYLAHGWNLAINREPLVADRVEAWDGGPVFRTIWNHLRDFGHNAVDMLLGHPMTKERFSAPISQSEKAVIDHVWSRYGGYSGLELSQMTHQMGTPWTNTYFAKGRNSRIPDDEIQSHFVGLALAGRG